MKAIVQDQFGTEETLVLREIDPPIVGDGEVLVRVHAASVHIGDVHCMTGKPYMLRIVGFGLRRPKVRVRGMDVAGTVEAVGPGVSRFVVGDEVFGTCDGAFAELAAVPQDGLARKPMNLTFRQAATVPTSGFASLQALRDVGAVQAGQKVLIIGASGGVGMFAVQIAKALGADVTGVCGASAVEMVRSLGADRVIDHTKEDFTQASQRYDLILDTGGSRPLSAIRRVLEPRGRLVLVGAEGGGRLLGGASRWVHAILLSPFVKQRLRPLTSKPDHEDLEILKGLVEAGQVSPIIDSFFPLEAVPDAFRHLAKRRTHGKIVIDVAGRRAEQVVSPTGAQIVGNLSPAPVA
jgi:NADPH:quinone reductase-like Zn-dependent oxidoreductase